MKDWHKEVIDTKINFSVLYSDGKLPDDIGKFIRDIWNDAYKRGKSSAELDKEDFKQFEKDFQVIRDDIDYTLRNFQNRIEDYFNRILEVKNEPNEN